MNIVTEIEADEPVAPLRPVPQERGRISLTDRILGATGVALACAAAFFPWYVFFNEEKFGVRLRGDDVSQIKTVGEAVDLIVARAG